MIAAPFFFRFSPKLFLSATRDRFGSSVMRPGMDGVRSSVKKSRNTNSEDEETKHTIIIGFGPVGQDVAKAMRHLGIPYKIVEMNHQVVLKYQKLGENISFGDASRERILQELGIEKAQLVVLTVSGASMTRAVLSSVRRLRPDVKVIVRTQFLREAEQLKMTPHTDLVVAEFETSVEVLARALRVYGVSGGKIHEFVVGIRQDFAETKLGMFDSLRKNIDGAAWEALSSIRPMRVKAGDYAVGKTLLDLDLRRATGATIVCVFRDVLGMMIPGGNDVIVAGDVVYLIGEQARLELAEKYIRAGRVQEEQDSYQEAIS